MSGDPDYILDLSSDQDVSATSVAGSPQPWIGVQFDCCGVYVRIYRRPDGATYAGHCPRCLRRAEVRVGPGGTTQRIFRAH
jgi:hypothetical protein